LAPSDPVPVGFIQQPPTTMHTETTETRTQFVATPQFGFAHLLESRTRTEPIHDFLVVQFGAVAETLATAGRGLGRAMRGWETGDLP